MQYNDNFSELLMDWKVPHDFPHDQQNSNLY